MEERAATGRSTQPRPATVVPATWPPAPAAQEVIGAEDGGGRQKPGRRSARPLDQAALHEAPEDHSSMGAFSRT